MKLLQLCLASLALSACSPNYHRTLDQRLIGKTPAERADLLIQECIQQASGSQEVGFPGQAGHVATMRRICEARASRAVSP